MSDWRDVMDARAVARDARNEAAVLRLSLDDGVGSDTARAVLLASAAVCAEIAALTTMLDYASGRVTLNV